MLNTIVGYIGISILAALIFGGIAMWIYIFYYRIKCRKITGCENEGCRNRAYCEKATMTEGEKRRILEMIAELGD